MHAVVFAVFCQKQRHRLQLACVADGTKLHFQLEGFNWIRGSVLMRKAADSDGFRRVWKVRYRKKNPEDVVIAARESIGCILGCVFQCFAWRYRPTLRGYVREKEFFERGL